MYTPSAGIYLHVPFCLTKCRYCDFYSTVADQVKVQEYFRRCIQWIQAEQSERPWKDLTYSTVFFGGGTPSIMHASMLTDLLTCIRKGFHFSDDQPEISIEVNPATINAQELRALRQAGFNRLSIGIQSLVDGELNAIGRLHSRADAIKTYKDARSAGFDNINLDLMYGLPSQSTATFEQSLESALTLSPEHLSIYELTLEPDTPLAEAIDKKELSLPAEWDIMQMAETIEKKIKHHGFFRYEISNYAQPGYSCRHNLNYWHNGSYLGIGPSAVSSHLGTRWTIPTDLKLFILEQNSLSGSIRDVDRLDQEAYFRETIFIGLRMVEGISIEDLKTRFGIDPVSYYGQTLRNLENKGLLTVENGRIRLSAKGLPLANMVMAELV